MTVVSRTLTRALNVCSRTIVDGVPTLTATTAANRMAGTSGLHLVGALNKWAGTSGRDIGFCLNVLANSSGLGVDEAASRVAANYEGQLLYDAAWYVDALYSDGGQSVANLGTGGTALNATLGSSASADSNDPKFLAYEGTPYVYLPGVAGNYLSVPDSAALDITGDIDIRVRVALDDWTPSATQMLVAKSTAYGTNHAYMLWVRTDGTIRLAISANGTTVSESTSTAATGVADGAIKWVRVTLDVDNGASGRDTKFWLSDDGSSWTQLGTTVTQAGTTSLYDSSAVLQIGSNTGGTSDLLAAKVYRAQVYNGIGGTLALDVDCSKIASGSATTFTEQSANAATVTINRSASGRKTVAVVGPLWLLGTDDYLEVADNALLDFSSTDSFTVLWVGRQWATIGGTLISKQTQASPYDGVAIRDWYGAAYYRWLCVQDGGPTSADVQSPAFTAGNMTVVTGVVNRSTQKATAYVGTSASSDVSTSSVGGFSNSYPLRIGRTSGGTEYYGNVEFIAAAVFRRVLTAAEIAAITSYYQSRYA